MIKVRPVQSGHSIKEAVISTFLAVPIIKPERFQELITDKFTDVFHQFEIVNQFQFQVNNKGGAVQHAGSQVLTNRGFRFSAFKNGKLQKVLQGVNEEGRSYISFHSLDYQRWASFFSDYKNYINIILEFHPNLFINGISLHYIDEFDWDNPELNDLTNIFDKNCSYLSKQFFNSFRTTYITTMEQTKEENTKYLDRIEIKVEPNDIRSFISISHNVTIPFDEPIELLNFTQTQQFTDTMMAAHLHNKSILKCLLKEEIKNLINLH